MTRKENKVKRKKRKLQQITHKTKKNGNLEQIYISYLKNMTRSKYSFTK